MSLKKLDELMINLNMPVLNAKDREILVECYDFDLNGGVGRDSGRQLEQEQQNSCPSG